MLLQSGMSIEGWVLFGALLMLFAFTVYKFSALIRYLLDMNREQTKDGQQILGSLETAIRQAAGQTNIFHADGNAAQAGTNQNNSGDGQGNQGQSVNNPNNRIKEMENGSRPNI